MKNLRLLLYILIVALSPGDSGHAQKLIPATGGRVTIVIEPVFNGQPLQLADQYYVNEHGDTLFIDLFRFYITNLKLCVGATCVTDTNSHLIDAENNATHTFHIDHVRPGSYHTLQFLTGVDSAANTSGANGGDLDPTKGMYWAWNSGYIMAKLEGHSKACKTLHHAFEFHIGGYKAPYNAAREVQLEFKNNLLVKNGGDVTIIIKADAAAWFKGNVDLSKVNSVVIPGKEACGVADRYAGMFSVSEPPINRN